MEEQQLKEQRLLEKFHLFFNKIKPSLKWVAIISIGVIIGGSILLFLTRGDEMIVSENEEEIFEDCNVIGINLHGTIQTYIPEHAEGDTFFDYDTVASENVIWSIDNANNDPKIKAIVVEVDSTGGYPVAGEEIANIIKNSEKPTVGLIRENGLSAAYWAISGADKIFASKNSTVGSIGVTQSYLNNVEKNKKDGYTFEQLSAGKFKDSGNPDAPLTKEEKDLFMRDINIVYQNFMEAISINRNIPIEKVRSFADGSSVLGDKAKELGLIDEIGGINEVEKYLEEKMGEKPEICWE
jgi:protease-4